MIQHNNVCNAEGKHITRDQFGLSPLENPLSVHTFIVVALLAKDDIRDTQQKSS